jgi:four helix bundle protein
VDIRSYRDLKVWQAAMELVERVYAVTKRFPRAEQYSLTSQLQRSAISVPSNIAEGHARSRTKDYLRFVSIARGSLAEMETQLMLAARLKYVEESDIAGQLELADQVGRMLRRLEQALERKISA